MSIKRWLAWMTLLVVVVALGCDGGGGTEETRGRTGPLLDRPAPEVVGQTSAGDSLKLSDFKGKVVMLDFWASWCGPCCSMFPHNKSLVSRYQGKRFVLLGVNCDEDLSKCKDMEANQKLTWQSWWDGPGDTIVRQYQVQAFPTIILIDTKGVVRYQFVGVPSERVLDQAIEKLVDEVE